MGFLAAPFAALGGALGASSATATLAGLTAVSTGVSVLGAMQQAQAARAQAETAARANEYNATVARNNAVVAGEQANAQEEQQRRRFRALQGQAIAGVAQSGTGFDGTNADLLAQNAILNELDALTIRYEGQQKQRGLLAQADMEMFQAGANRANGRAATTAGYLNAASSVLSGAAKYATYSKTSKTPGEV